MVVLGWRRHTSKLSVRHGEYSEVLLTWKEWSRRCFVPAHVECEVERGIGGVFVGAGQVQDGRAGFWAHEGR